MFVQSGNLCLLNCPFIWCVRVLGSAVPAHTQAGEVCVRFGSSGVGLFRQQFKFCAELEASGKFSDLSDPPITWKTPGAPWGKSPRADFCSPSSPVLTSSLMYELSVPGFCPPFPASVWHHPRTSQLSCGCLSPRCLSN